MSLNTAGLRLKDASTITIASGVATIAQSFHLLAAESGTADDLDTIAVSALSDLLVAAIDYRPFVIIQADAGDTITVRHNVGNIRLNGGADYALSGDKKIILFYDGSVWTDLGVPGAGGGGGIGGSTGGTDNALLRADGTGGSTVQNSAVIVDDSGNMTGTPRITLDDIRAATSAGVAIETAGGTDILLLGAGGSPNGTFYGNVSMDTTHKIVNMADPTNAQDAATKNYVDTQFPVGPTEGGTGQTTYATGDILYASASNTLAKRTIGTTGQVLTVAGGVPTWATASSADYVRLSFTVASGTSGGTATSGSWIVRPINTEDNDASNICSLSGNEFTLAAGTYQIMSSAAFSSNTGVYRTRLFNVTDSSVILTAIGRFNSTVNHQDTSDLSGRFVLDATKTLRVEYRVNATLTTTGLGAASSFGVDEIYATVDLWRVAQ